MDVLRGSKELLLPVCLIQLECENENQKEVLEFLSKIGIFKLEMVKVTMMIYILLTSKLNNFL